MKKTTITSVQKQETIERHPLHDRLNLHRFIFCPGCLIGTVITSLASVLKEMGLKPKDYAIVSGIGCTGRSSGCFTALAFHTTHGRAIPFAIGLKAVKPELKVFVLSGDGDLSSIGGNHLIHAARRNIDITVICINNNVFGMTGGQVAPTTQMGDFTQTTPYGNIDPPFNLVKLVAFAGATYVARWPGYDTLRMRRSFKKAIEHKGFSFIEILAPCFTQYGKFNRLGDAIRMIRWIEEMIEIRTDVPPHEATFDYHEKKVICGEFVHDTNRQEYTELLYSLQEKAKGKKKGESPQK